MNIASTLARGFFCWVCSLVFTVLKQENEPARCPQCSTVVAVSDSPAWPEHQAWCARCNLFYGTTWMRGLKPECPRCGTHCDGTNPTEAEREILRQEAVMAQVQLMHSWGEEHFSDLNGQGFRADEIADRFLFEITRSQPALVNRQTAEDYFRALAA